MTGPHGGAFSGRVGWGTAPALVVVDLVRAYTAAGGPFLLPEPGRAVEATGRLVDAAREHGRPVLWTVVRYTTGLADGGLFVRKVPALAAFAEDADGGWGSSCCHRPRASR
jgi:maleamate amidohydrolase